MHSPIGIIAGAGQFPIHVAEEAKRQGAAVVGIGIEGWVDPAFASHVEAYEELPIGQLKRLIERLKAHQVRHVIMAGKVTKEVLVKAKDRFDAEALAIIIRAGGNMSANALLGAVGKRLAREGMTLMDSSALLSDSLCPVGVLTKRRPTADEERDIRLGAEAARAMAALDVGQTVVVKSGVIVAVEALEGTDAAILRAHGLAGAGCVVVKTGSKKQDRRFDLPVIGPMTIATLREASAACLAVEARTTLMLDRAAIVQAATEAGLCLVGLR
ncbi:MAG: UDP-2,3-diacylglucosamine diphosphatase LpxI [Candidatus Omnitrophica bacterium]|nr:UDP-2,3-diacylglucosamine diphosphatase LpxI [Candidatus Omnitrophota bacterium]